MKSLLTVPLPTTTSAAAAQKKTWGSPTFGGGRSVQSPSIHGAMFGLNERDAVSIGESLRGRRSRRPPGTAYPAAYSTYWPSSQPNGS